QGARPGPRSLTPPVSLTVDVFWVRLQAQSLAELVVSVSLPRCDPGVVDRRLGSTAGWHGPVFELVRRAMFGIHASRAMIRYRRSDLPRSSAPGLRVPAAALRQRCRC